MRTNRDLGGKPMGWPVARVDRGRALVVTSRGMPAGTYAFVLESIAADSTRLIVRDRARWKTWEWPFAWLVYEPLHGYMETGLIEGVRRRAEAPTDLASHESGRGAPQARSGPGTYPSRDG